MTVSKDRTERIKLIREKTGDRLKEMLDGCCSQRELLRRTEEKYGKAYFMQPSHLSEIINYKRTLPREFATKFADILEIQAGYLLGDDDFTAGSYSEYLELKTHKEDATRSFSEFQKINFFLMPTGYTLDNITEWNSKISSYDIKVNNDVVSIPAAEMARTLDDINRYIKMQIDHLVESNK